MRFGFNANCSVDGVLDVVANVIQAGLSLGVSYPLQYLSILTDMRMIPEDSQKTPLSVGPSLRCLSFKKQSNRESFVKPKSR